MKTAKKVWIIIAVCLIVLGAVIGTISLAMVNFDLANLNTQKFISDEHKITGDFSNIKIDVDTADIEFVYSENNECMVITVYPDKTKHNVSVKNGTLTVSTEDNRDWYDYIGIFSGETSITIHLPKQSYDSLTIEADTSNITLPKDFMFGNAKIETDTGDVDFFASALEKIDIKTSTGDVLLKDVTCENADIKSSTGNINFSNIVIKKHCSINNSTGDVTLEQSDAETIYIKTSTGHVTCTLLSKKTFVTKTSTGDINVPKTSSGGKCEIITSTGDINIKVK